MQQGCYTSSCHLRAGQKASDVGAHAMRRVVSRSLQPVRLISLQRPLSHSIPQAVAGGGGGIGGSSGGGSGGGGGGGGGGDSAGSGDESGKPESGLLTGWRQRVAFDPEFPLKVLMEQVIGVGASVVGDMSSRPNWGLYELDLVFATLVVGSILNFTIMYLLAPTVGVVAAAGGAVASTSLLTRILGDSILKSWKAPGSNMFEPGAYSVASRLLNLVYKGGVFSVIGFGAGIFGTATSTGLLNMRKMLDPTFELQNDPPNVILNAACWGLHMGASANIRYQVLGGADQFLVKAMPVVAFRVYQAVIRGANNIVGGISFVTLARLLGVQKAASPETVAIKAEVPKALVAVTPSAGKAGKK